MWHAWGRGDLFTGFWLGGPKGRDHWEDLGVGERITLPEGDRDQWGELDSAGSEKGPVAGLCEHSSEP
jgi:hypothetical protein